MTNEKLEFQCWICPKCHDDHKQGDPCVMQFQPEEFMPSNTDLSYLASMYRLRVRERDEYREALEKIIAIQEWATANITAADIAREALQETP